MEKQKFNLDDFSDSHVLSRAEMQTVTGGKAPGGCSLSVNCAKQEYNSSTGKWETVVTGQAACSGDTSCTATPTGVSCVNNSGPNSTSDCQSGSAPE